jgi:hypothetical protein
VVARVWAKSGDKLSTTTSATYLIKKRSEQPMKKIIINKALACLGFLI